MRIMCVAVVLVFFTDRHRLKLIHAGPGRHQANPDARYEAPGPSPTGLPDCKDPCGTEESLQKPGLETGTTLGTYSHLSHSTPRHSPAGRSQKSISDDNRPHRIPLTSQTKSNNTSDRNSNHSVFGDIDRSYSEFVKKEATVLKKLTQKTGHGKSGILDLLERKTRLQTAHWTTKGERSVLQTDSRHNARTREQRASMEINKNMKPRNNLSLHRSRRNSLNTEHENGTGNDGNDNGTGNDDNGTGDDFKTDSPPPLYDDTTESTSLLDEPTGFKKVALLVLYTFPAGMFTGYVAIAILFYVRYKRFLCCTSKCEEILVACLCLSDYPKTFQNIPNLVHLQISQRRPEPFQGDHPDIQNLRKQFEEDQRFYQLYGKDPMTNEAVGDFVKFHDDPALSKQEWGKKRMMWWLANDRRRSLKGIFTEPGGTPESSMYASGEKKWSADFTSVSEQQGTSYRISTTSFSRDYGVDDEASMASSQATSVDSETTTNA